MDRQTEIAKLIELHRPYARAIAVDVLKKLPSAVDRDDVHASAELGLVEAAQAFDPARGVLFRTFAYYRIKGAIYDALSKMGWFSKSHYHHLRFERAANEYLKDASEAQLSDLKALTRNILACYVFSLQSLPQEPVDARRISAEEQVNSQQQGEQVRQALAHLPEKNRKVLDYYYYQDLTLDQIGQKLGLSKSWVSRLHAKGLEAIRELLAQGSTGIPACVGFRPTRLTAA